MTQYKIGICTYDYQSEVHGEDGPYTIFTELHHIEATDVTGHVWVLADSPSEDKSFVEHLLWHLDHDPGTMPNAWIESSPIYGSEAWDDEAEYELACFEADAFGEPRPRW